MRGVVLKCRGGIPKAMYLFRRLALLLVLILRSWRTSYWHKAQVPATAQKRKTRLSSPLPMRQRGRSAYNHASRRAGNSAARRRSGTLTRIFTRRSSAGTTCGSGRARLFNV